MIGILRQLKSTSTETEISQTRWVRKFGNVIETPRIKSEVPLIDLSIFQTCISLKADANYSP